jgi:undecaprenyl-diphosphatase
VFFWRDWLRILAGFATSLRYRRIQTPEERLAWLIVVGTIPVGLAGLALEHLFRTTLGKPVPAAVFLLVNGVILFAGERLRRRVPASVGAAATSAAPPGTVDNDVDRAVDGASVKGRGQLDESDLRLARMPMARGVLIGSAQILALLPGISRSGVTMVAGLMRGLNHDDAARFAFLLATPVIMAAGMLKIPDLFGPLGAGIHGQVLAGSVASFVSAYFAVRFLTRYFHTRTLTPFAIYCTVAGAASYVWLAIH